MQYIFSLLPLLACPVGMGLMMWLMMRVGKDTTPRETNQGPMNTSGQPQAIPYASEVPNASPQRTPLFKMLLLCLNWKVVAGLVIVGVIVWAVAPQLLLGAVPLLIVAACPLSMLFMMRGMQGGREKTPALSVQAMESTAFELPPDEHLGELRSRQSELHQEQDYLTRQIAELEGAQVPADSEAVPVVQAAKERSVPGR